MVERALVDAPIPASAGYIRGMGTDWEIEGWFFDPFERHQHRWFSAGTPTSLVRDDGVESQESPPEGGFAEPLVPVEGTPDGVPGGDDLRRADVAESRDVDVDNIGLDTGTEVTSLGPMD